MKKDQERENQKIQKKANKSHGLATKLVRGGLNRSLMSETSEPLYLNSGFVYHSFLEAKETFDSEIKTDRKYVYARFGSPTNSMFEEKLALLENAKHCFSTASGMSASFGSIMPFIKPNSRIVASKALFSSNKYILSTFLKNWQVEVEFVNGENLDEWQAALSRKADLVFFESPSNPLLGITDIKAVCRLAKAAKALVVVDNAIASPILQKPLELGADIVFHSATKFIDGQGRVLAGAILTNNTKIAEEILTPFLRNLGLTLASFNAWILVKSLDTLELRVMQQTQNAKKVVDFLIDCKKVTRVYYPGLADHKNHEIAAKQMNDFGSMVAFELGSGVLGCQKFLDALKLIDISNNLGDTKTLITHPTTTTHQSLTEDERIEQGITDKVVRMSVGLEDPNDIIADLKQAIDKS